MSNKYKQGDRVPNGVLANRLDELANAVTKGDKSPFVMRVPAELDFCPDLVMSQAAQRLREFESAFMTARVKTPKRSPGGYIPDVISPMISVWLMLVAMVVSLAAWLVWAVCC